MPSSEEVKQLEGVSAAQHRFRLSVDTTQDGGLGLRPMILEPPGNGPFLYAQLPFRNSRYKEKFQALREKYDRITAKQEEYHRDLEIATAKIKKLQAENDLLLDAMNLAATHQPSLFPLLPPPLPPDAPPPGVDAPMDLDAFGRASTSAAPLLSDRPLPRHINGNGAHGTGGTGTRSGTTSSLGMHMQTNGHAAPIESRPSRQPSIEFMAHDTNGRGP
ncbi:hypothetical protein B0H15DRAFT_839190 [Mycena belliarum]|uniref:Uncharacterized protein n=1 Tax=Mycena belliarum TaxID=1033014 RepID=A0AAD6U9G6_9AGAR|nr:hypothetical protein B0H15DRAFT_839190 [Mycena belliae]